MLFVLIDAQEGIADFLIGCICQPAAPALARIGQFVSVGRGIAVDLRRVVEELDSDLGRAWIALADPEPEAHEHLFAARVVELPQLLNRK